MKSCADPRIAVLACTLISLFSTAFAVDLVPETPWCGPFDSPARLDTDPATHTIYVSCPRTGEIYVLNQAGAVQSIVTSLSHPTALAADGSGNLYVSDGQAVRKLDGSGNELLLLGGSETYFANPHDVHAAGGLVYVSDTDDTVKVFRPDGSFVRSISRGGYFPGRIDDAVALATDANGTDLYISDQNNHRVQVFDSAGFYQRTWGTIGTGDFAASEFLRPFGLEVDSHGRIWVLDAILNTVQVFDPLGQFLFMCHLDQPVLRGGVDIAIDDDVLYVTAPSQHCVLPYRIVETGVRDNPELELTITLEAGGVRLRWNPVAGAASYRVQRCDDVSFPEADLETLAILPGTSYTDTDALANWNARFYRVVAEGIPSSCAFEPGYPEAPLVSQWSDCDSGEPPILSHDRPHTVTYGVRCSSCHFSRYSYPNPVPDWWFGDHLCKSCHVETGKAQPQQNHFTDSDTMYCEACHDPHDQQDQYPHFFIRTSVSTPHNGDRNLWFNHATDFIHGAPAYDGICETCHTQTAHHRNNESGDHTHFAGSNCVTCHKHLDGFRPSGGAGGACNSCHGAPPSSGAHVFHVGLPDSGVAYGDLRQTSDFADSAEVYHFGCGQCHPVDAAWHMDGDVDVELYNPSVPTTTLKGKNPSTATFAGGTCSNIYCHSSGNDAEYRTYAAADWNRSTPYGCGDCHGEPPTYDSYSIGGPGANSHYQYLLLWGDADIGHVLGIHWGHDSSTVANGTGTVLNCNTCHYETVTSNQNTGLTDSSAQASCAGCHDVNTIPPAGNRGVIANTARHVSGIAEVVFSPQPFRSPYTMSSVPPGWTRFNQNQQNEYDETILTNSASYNAATKTCSSVPCHLDQVTVQWGYWGTDFDAGCECHNVHSSGLSARHNGQEANTSHCSDCHGPRFKSSDG